MTRERKTHFVTIAVLLLALGVALGRKEGWRLGRAPSQEQTSPQEAIYTMLDAARNGNVAAYLASYTGQMQASLQESVRESTEAAFGKYLKDTNAAIKGVAASDPQFVSDNEVSVRVEYVYEERNEVQTVHLVRVSGAWRIARVDGAERIKTLVPYGTPVR
jgi:hypothetical protein